MDEKQPEIPLAVVGAAPNAVKNQKPPLFNSRWFSPISYILYLWYSPILRLGSRRTLVYDDVFDTPEALKTENIYPEFHALFEKQVEDSQNSGPKGEERLKDAKEGKTSKFVLYTIFGRHKYRLLFAFSLQLCYSGIQFVGPIMLNKVVKFLVYADTQDALGEPVESSRETDAWLFAMAMFIGPVLGTLAAGQANRISIGTQIMIRSELTAAIYRKALRLSTRSRQATETGRIVNLMSADVNQLQMFFYPFASQLLTGPAMLIASLVLLWFQIGWATFIGLGILLVSTPATSIFVKKLVKYRRQMLKYTDTRVKLMNQLLVGIRVLKMYAWESAQEAAVLEVRKKELGELRKAIPMRVGMQTLLFAAPTLAMVVCFVAYGSAEPENFSPAAIFTSISLFALMRFPLIFLPFALIQLSNALVSMRRLSQYFLLEERHDTVEDLGSPGIEIDGGEFYWAEPPPKIPEIGGKKKKGGGKDKKKGKKEEEGGDDVEKKEGVEEKGTDESAVDGTTPVANGNGVHANGDDKKEVEAVEDTTTTASKDLVLALPGMSENTPPTAQFVLRDVNLSVAPGELVCVVGRVGCGKSSLVQALLGEMEAAEGKVRIGGRVAYAAQQAWIINATLKDNVTFGKPFNEEKWQAAVEACCLAQDLDVLPGGADTEIGEKGINLSGGQKQRVSLARALYQDAEVYILDDPLSAVDVHVGKHIFEQFINGAIADKARLLITNQLQYLPYADRVVVIDAGNVVVSGTYDECQSHEVFQNLLAEHNSQSAEVADATKAGDASIASAAKEAGGAGVGGGKPPLPSKSASTVAVEALKTPPTKASPFDTNNNTDSPSTTDGVGSKTGEASPTTTNNNNNKVPAPERSESAVGYRTTVEALSTAPGALGRAPVQDTQLERGVTFARLPSFFGGGRRASNVSSKSGRFNLSRDLEGGATTGKGSQQQQASQADSGVYGRQLMKMETMRQVALSERKKSGKKGVGEQDTMVDGKGALMIKEDKEVGQVTGKVYWTYITAYGVVAFFCLILLWSAEQSVRILTNWYLSQWVQAESENSFNQSQGIESSFNRGAYIGGYLGFAFGFVCLTCVRATTNLLSALTASRVIHANALSSLVRAPVSFFDTTPVGRILNRFSKDTDDVDFLLSMSMSEFGNCIMQLLATLIFIAVIQPWILVGIAPLMCVYYLLQRYYRKSYIEMQRLDATSRSPIYAHFSESLSGIETIRAYRLADAFARTSDLRVDSNHRAYFTSRMANEWLSLRLDLIGACIVFGTAALSIIKRDTISASLAALTLSEALDVTLFLKSAVTSGAMFETRFNSVERLCAYWQLPQEAPAKDPDHAPSEEWPTEGCIEYEDVWMRYRPGLEPVLKGVTFDVQPGEKVGIVGRTGSGKSSLIVTLFRIVEPYQGRILLDGVDLLTLGLDDVRGRIAAIPQDPVLFSGTVRTNLDPYDRHTDAELWEALGHVALREVVGALGEGLSARVAEGGENWSVGQRQLLCVGRALLRNPKVLVADEATASVDSETDSLIQKTIRREFSQCTVLTIAHRLNTVLDSTRVLVMEDGVVGEYDTVPSLMGRSQSTFRKMVLQAGLDSPAGSRASSSANLAALAEGGGGDGGNKKLMGMATFKKKMQDKFDLQ